MMRSRRWPTTCRQQDWQIVFLMGHSRPLFLYLRLFYKHLTVNKCSIKVVGRWLDSKPWSSSIGSNCAINCVTTTDYLQLQLEIYFYHFCFLRLISLAFGHLPSRGIKPELINLRRLRQSRFKPYLRPGYFLLWS